MTPYPSPGKDGEYFAFVPGENDRGPLMRVESKPTGDKLFVIMADFAMLLANQSNNLIIDDVLFDDQHLKSYVDKLAEHIAYFIGIKCDLAIMQAVGLSNDQFARVHSGTREYDLTVDTSNSSVFSVAREIIDFIDSNQKPKGFNNMRNKFYG